MLLTSCGSDSGSSGGSKSGGVFSGVFNGDALLPYIENGKIGFLNESGKVIIPAQFDNAMYFSNGLAPVRVSEKWGYINKKGELIINPQFDYASPFDNEVVAIKVDSKYGFINTKGEIVINPQFNEIRFSKGPDFYTIFRLVSSLLGKKSDDRLFLTQFRVNFFEEGLQPVSVGSKWGYIDKSGKFIINPQFNAAFHFENGIAIVKRDTAIQKRYEKENIILNSYINKKGNIGFTNVLGADTKEEISQERHDYNRYNNYENEYRRNRYDGVDIY